jgi:hypothetical protein
MKISFPNCGSGVGMSIRAAINVLLNQNKVERAQTTARKRNLPQIAAGWDYRPRESVRRHAVVDAAQAETAETQSSSPSAVDANNVVWFDLINPDPVIEDARTKAPLRGRAYASSKYD